MLVWRIVPARKVRREGNEAKNLSVLRVVAVLWVVFALVSLAFVWGGLASEGEDVAVSTILGAEGSMGLAYQGVLEAEEAGANVSRLLARLNVAGEYLARAHTSLRKCDFAGAIDNANHGREIAEEVKAEAGELKELAPRERYQQLLFWMIRSMIAISVIGVGTVISWYMFKRRSNWQISEKPEVNEAGA